MCRSAPLFLMLSLKQQRRRRVVERNKLIVELAHLAVDHRCQLCGCNFQRMTFHHIDPRTKKYEISQTVSQGATAARLITEIEKCTLLCVSCHRLVHKQDVRKKFKPIDWRSI